MTTINKKTFEIDKSRILCDLDWKSNTSVGFSVAFVDRAKFGFYQFQSFFFIVVIVISILLKPTFWQISIYSQSLVKIL